MENKILIEPIINKKAHGFAVQAEIFSFDLRIKNMSEKPSSQFDITRIILESAEGKNLVNDFSGRSFFVDILNPNEDKIINVGKSGQFLYGLVNINVTAKPKDPSVQIKFMQEDPFTKETSELAGHNSWVDFFYIKSLSEYSQEKTNKRMMILTYAIVFLALIQLGIIFLSFYGL